MMMRSGVVCALLNDVPYVCFATIPCFQMSIVSRDDTV
jgi:hypothetical protein